MVFSSVTFLFIFLPIVLLTYYIINTRHRNLFLTIASLFFYAWGEQMLVFLMVFSIATNYLGGLLIGYFVEKNVRALAKIGLLSFVFINVALLFYFKYTNFFFESFNSLKIVQLSEIEEVILPIGISFFTFQGMSYLIDIYQKKVVPQRNLTSLALYISMFPQLIAGPIVRYIDISKQIELVRGFNVLQFNEGIRRFVIGLFKKVIIANQMGYLADIIFNTETHVGTISLWIGIVCYSLQIYYDFSGYSDMAIGLGKMFGFDFLENFDHPYISNSIQEFWRRWHISLSSWFRDYLYIPLGGNKKGVARTYINLIIVFAITGLWHGSSWNFVVWGLFHGSFLILERIWLKGILSKTLPVVGHIYTLLVVIVGWVFFRSETFAEALIYCKGMFFPMGGENQFILQYITPYFICIFILAILFSFDLRPILTKFKASWINKIAFIEYPFYLLLFFICLVELAESNYNPFIYFRF